MNEQSTIRFSRQSPARNKPAVYLAVFAAFVLAGCQASNVNLPTPIPTEILPTVIALTIQANLALTPQPEHTPTDLPTLIAPTNDATATRTPYLSPTWTGSPTATRTPRSTQTPTHTSSPTITPTASDTPRPEIPPAAVRILRPAPLSRLISPLEVNAVLAPGAGGVYRIELLGEDGRLLVRQVLDYPGIRVNTSVNLDFEIPGVAETGRLQIYTQDVFGRIIALSSSNVILLSVGQDEYNTSADLRERIFIQKPGPDDLILGGSLTIFGKAWPNQTEPLLVELIAENGAVVGQRLVAVQALEGEDYGIFEAEIPYQVNEPTPVRLTIYEDIDRIPGKTHISTLEILLNP
jgi:hypothetical protein